MYVPGVLDNLDNTVANTSDVLLRVFVRQPVVFRAQIMPRDTPPFLRVI